MTRKIEYLGPQPQNGHFLALPLAIMMVEGEHEDGRTGLVFAISILWFNFAWWCPNE